MNEKTISTAELIAALKGSDEEARWNAVDRAPAAGAGAIGPLAEVMAGGDPAAAKAASEALRKIAYSSGGAARELVRLLDPEHPRAVRADAARYLGRVGGRGEIRALVALLSDQELAKDALMALEQIPGAEAETALRRAAETGPAVHRNACMQSLRNRQTHLRDAGIRRG